jgi:hypothetical protein
VRSSVHSVVWGRQLKLRFVLPEGELSEKEFFDFVGGNCEGAAPSLRRLLAAYDAATRTTDIWSDEGVAALGYAALALARLDPEAYIVLDGYFRRRDLSREVFGTEHVLPAIAAMTGSFGNIGALRFALQRLPEETLAVGMGDRLAIRIIKGARACCSPGRFVAEVERAARSIMWKADIEVWSLAGSRAMREVRDRMAAQEEYVRQGLVVPLLRAADPTEDWDFAFLVKARHKRIRYPQTALRWVESWQRIQHMKAAQRPRPAPRQPPPPKPSRVVRERNDRALRAKLRGALAPTRAADVQNSEP